MKLLPWLLLLFIVVALHPLADAGSDSDDALEIGAVAVISGQNPYSRETHLGNPLTPLPGWILLNLPAAIIGAHAWCMVWVFFALRGQPWQAVAVVFVLSSKTLIQGIDYVANACAVLWLCSVFQARFLARGASAAPVEPMGAPIVPACRSGHGCGQSVRMGRTSDQPEILDSDGGNYASRVMCAGVLLLLPPLWVSNAAYHVLLSLPFFVAAVYWKGWAYDR